MLMNSTKNFYTCFAAKTAQAWNANTTADRSVKARRIYSLLYMSRKLLRTCMTAGSDW